ncbi:hypothetical protein PgNI_05904, partial [Pyricularia grisea]|uniref:Uncharacterized protein n=1 Tax=Pyricularia grisea TaxID=148305 RepID=A0A6P8B4S0_PYRGI
HHRSIILNISSCSIRGKPLIFFLVWYRDCGEGASVSSVCQAVNLPWLKLANQRRGFLSLLSLSSHYFVCSHSTSVMFIQST